MQQAQLLHNFLAKASVIAHAGRSKALCQAVNAVTEDAPLTLTGIARQMKGGTTVRHKIKKIDLLLSNGHLQSETPGIYAALIPYVVNALDTLIILIDWSAIGVHEHHLLKASLYTKKRSVTLYEELHPEEKLSNSKVQYQFLKNLKNLLPNKRIIVIADAGFRTDFCQQVVSLGWDYLVRVRTCMCYQPAGESTWHNCTDLYPSATDKPAYVGEVLLSKASQVKAHLYLYKETLCNKQSRRKHPYQKTAHIFRRRYKTPWLLATSLSGKEEQVWQIIKAYKKRMRIEHEFRDLKDPKWGLGLGLSRTRCASRKRILLLVAHLSLFLLWVIGLVAEHNDWHYHFYANSTEQNRKKQKRILSLVYLAKQIIKQKYVSRITYHDITNAFSLCQKQIRDDCSIFEGIT